MREFNEPVTPRVESLTRPATQLEDAQVWIDGKRLPFGLLQIVVYIGEQVKLIYNHDL
jgi:hypothetical protein